MPIKLLAPAVLLLGLIANGQPAASAPAPMPASRHATETGPVMVETLVEGLEHPWSLAFLPDGRLLVTERPGRLRLIADGRLLPDPVPGLPPVAAAGQGGLLDIALHPDFASNRLLYLSLAGAGPGGAATEVWRGRLVEEASGLRLDGAERILAAGPYAGGGRHFGSRLVFAPDGTLFVSAGERGDRRRAQDEADPAGSILRIADDGSIPADNPFLERGGARPELYAMGVRNPQGMTLDPATGALWEVEHGPRGGDEVNLIRPGRNYGWPLITYGEEYSGRPVGQGRTARAGLEQPLLYWVPSISPSGLAFYTGSAFPAWQGNLFTGSLSQQHLRRMVLKDGRPVHQEALLADLGHRIRDVRQGPDGLLYLLVDSAGAPLLRLRPGP